LLFAALGGGHPIRLFVGVSLSFALKFAVLILAEAFPESGSLKVINGTDLWFIILMITPLMFVPLIWGGSGAFESAVLHANTVRKLMNEARLTKIQERLIWLELINRYVQAVRPELSEEVDLKRVFDEIVKELEGQKQPK
jgi:hypothetical protein